MLEDIPEALEEVKESWLNEGGCIFNTLLAIGIIILIIAGLAILFPAFNEIIGQYMH